MAFHDPSGRTRDGGGIWLTIVEAAAATGSSRDTIKRRLRDGAFRRARREGRDQNARWLIPLGDIIDAGFSLDPATVASTVADKSGGAALPQNAGDEITTLRMELLKVEGRAALAEAVCRTQAAHIESLSATLDQVIRCVPGTSHEPRLQAAATAGDANRDASVAGARQ